ncbi:MAG: Holliday junction resolvase [uncultured bacterium]|nr:MAG: Holliday junction resolvase [uncultured bacterium]
MMVLGIDPGIGRCGWGIVDVNGSKVSAKDYGCIETKANGAIEKRLLVISLAIEKLIKEYRPDVLAIEELFFSGNAKTAFAVGQARGVILLAAGKSGMSVAIYTPLQVKMALTGYGRADKNQIGQMVKVILKLEKIPKIDDTSDALAVALAHAFSAKMSAQRKL